MNGHSQHYFDMINIIIEKTKEPFSCPLHGQYPENHKQLCNGCELAQLNYEKAIEYLND